MRKVYRCPVCNSPVSVGVWTVLPSRSGTAHTTCMKCRSALVHAPFWQVVSAISGIATIIGIELSLNQGYPKTKSDLVRLFISIVVGASGACLVTACVGLLSPRLVLDR